MKNNKFRSFRFEIIVYTILSMICTFLTIAVLLLGIGIVYFSLGGSLPIQATNQMESVDNELLEEVTLMNSMNSSINNLKNFANYEGKSAQIIDKGMLSIGLICISVFAIILFIAYFLKFTKKFSTYMNELMEGIGNISQGNFEHYIQIETNDEFGQIAGRMNQMTKDISNIIEANRKDEDRKHELITSVAHDLRTPLTSVIGYLDLLKKGNIDEKTKEHYLQIVYSKSKRLEQLIEDLFSYTKYTYGSVAVIGEPVDLVKLLEQLLEEFYPSFEENHLKVEFYKDCPTLISYADGNLLARAFANLIGNAIKYGNDGKRVELFFSHSNDNVRITVKNYGAIIPEQDLPRIFERFYRVENSRSRETGGSGLGLAIAKSIVLMHHGEINAQSSLVGTTFEVCLPIIREPESKDIAKKE